MAQHFHNLTVAKVNRETPNCVSIQFDIPSNLSSQFEYKNGQYVTIEQELGGQKVRRSYSICSAHQAKDPFAIAVKEVPNGTMSPGLNQKLTAGTTLKVSEPEGGFTLPLISPAGHIFFYAGGSGITPVLSLLKQVLHTTQAKAHLLYANTADQEIIFQDKIAQLAKDFGDRFQVQYFVEDANTQVNNAIVGRMQELYIRNLPFENNGVQHHFICGPGPLMEFVKTTLENQAVAGASIHLEYFEAPEEDLPDTSAFKGKSKVKVILDGEETTVEIDENESILDAILDAGLDAPYSCQGGVCATCRAHINHGEVYLSQNLGISDGEIKEGYTLACSSYPRSSEIEINFDEA